MRISTGGHHDGRAHSLLRSAQAFASSSTTTTTAAAADFVVFTTYSKQVKCACLTSTINQESHSVPKSGHRQIIITH